MLVLLIVILVPLGVTGHLGSASSSKPQKITAVYEDYVPPDAVTVSNLPGMSARLCDTFCNNHPTIVKEGSDMGWKGAIGTTVVPDKSNQCTCVPSSTYAFGALGVTPYAAVQSAINGAGTPTPFQQITFRNITEGTACDVFCNYQVPSAVSGYNTINLGGSVAAKNWPVAKPATQANLVAAGYPVTSEPGYAGAGCFCMAVNDATAVPYYPFYANTPPLQTETVSADHGETCEQACQAKEVPNNPFNLAPGVTGAWTRVGSNTPAPDGTCSCVLYPSTVKRPDGISLTL